MNDQFPPHSDAFLILFNCNADIFLLLHISVRQHCHIITILIKAENHKGKRAVVVVAEKTKRTTTTCDAVPRKPGAAVLKLNQSTSWQKTAHNLHGETRQVDCLARMLLNHIQLSLAEMLDVGSQYSCVC